DEMHAAVGETRLHAAGVQTAGHGRVVGVVVLLAAHPVAGGDAGVLVLAAGLEFVALGGTGLAEGVIRRRVVGLPAGVGDARAGHADRPDAARVELRDAGADFVDHNRVRRAVFDVDDRG